MTKPRARLGGLILRELGEELVVYDKERHQAHCLAARAAAVFRCADGTRAAADIAALLGTGPQAVSAVLDQLAAAGLLEGGPAPDECVPSRRELLRQAGLRAAVLAPVIHSLFVPAPAEAAASCVRATQCAGNEGRPCWISNPQAECPTYTCRSGSCRP